MLRKRVVSLAFRRMMVKMANEAKARRESEEGIQGSAIVLALRRMQASTEVPVTPPNHAYRAQQMLYRHRGPNPSDDKPSLVG